MSVATPKLPAVSHGGNNYHPWKALGRLDHIALSISDHLPSGRAWWCPASQTILLASNLTQAERRCALAHELAHIDLGHTGRAAAVERHRQERQADELAARRLITLPALVDAVLWARDEYEAADELWVDPGTLHTRLQTLTPLERAELDRSITAVENHHP